MKRDYDETQSAFSVVREEFFPMTDQLSVVARAIAEARRKSKLPRRDDSIAYSEELAKAAIAAHEAALKAEGLVILPREPANRMIEELFTRAEQLIARDVWNKAIEAAAEEAKSWGRLKIAAAIRKLKKP